MALFGKGPQAMPSALADEPWIVAGAGILPLQALLPAAALVLAVALRLVMTRTTLGLRVAAAVQQPDAAALMGIDVRRLITGTYAASAALAGFVSGGLAARDLEVAFGGVRAVAGVSFDAPPGAVTSIIGPNGAGKTTLLNLIGGFQPPMPAE
jgi:branched-subunit amino acid ABC-type transport system permease component